MTQIFVAHAEQDANCAEQMRRDLEAKGYTTWRQPASLQVRDLLSSHTMETVLLGSAAVILLWSQHAAQAGPVAQQVLFAQGLHKPIVLVLLDGTALPATLVAAPSLSGQDPCTDVVARLLQLAVLPAPGSTDPLLVLAEQAASDLLRERKAAIELAARLLAQDEQREAVLAILAYLAQHDQMDGVREKAKEAIAADTQRHAQGSAGPLPAPAPSPHVFGVPCKNGHVTYFDKRKVCRGAISQVHRIVRGGQPEEVELVLECGTCHEQLPVRVECGGYL